MAERALTDNLMVRGSAFTFVLKRGLEGLEKRATFSGQAVSNFCPWPFQAHVARSTRSPAREQVPAKNPALRKVFLRPRPRPPSQAGFDTAIGARPGVQLHLAGGIGRSKGQRKASATWTLGNVSLGWMCDLPIYGSLGGNALPPLHSEAAPSPQQFSQSLGLGLAGSSI